MRNEQGAAKRVEMVRMDQVPDLQDWWLWPERIPMGNLTLLVGCQDAGKSRVAWDLAARVSRGDIWPDGEMNPLGAGSVLLVGSENHWQIAARPALQAAGADMAKVGFARSIRQKDRDGQKSKRTFDLRLDLDALESMIVELKDCRMIIIDSVGACLGSGGGAKTEELLRGLLDLPARYHLAVVGVTHLRRGNGEAIDRVVGGLTLTTAARCIWALARDSREEEVESRGERRLFLPLKNNLSAERMGLAFDLVVEAGQKAPRVAWSAEAIEATADEAYAALRARLKEQPKAVQEAMEYLKDALGNGPRWVKELEAEAKTRGISQITLRRARVALDVETYREVVPGPWSVRLGSCQLSVVGCQLPEVGIETGRHGDAERERENRECESVDHVEHVAEITKDIAKDTEDHVEHVGEGCQFPEVRSAGKDVRTVAQPPQPRPFSPGVPEEKGAEIVLLQTEDERGETKIDYESVDHVEHVATKRWNLATSKHQIEIRDDPLLCGSCCEDRHETGRVAELSVLGRRQGRIERRKERREH